MTTEIPTFDELYAKAQTAALLASSQISDLSFQPGYLFDVHTGEAGSLAEEVLRIALGLHANTFIDHAEADDLDTLAKDHFDLDRDDGISAIGIVTFSRPNADFGNVTINAGTIIETSDGLQFVTTTAPLMIGLTVEANVSAVVPGLAGGVAAGTLLIINSTTALDDSTITVTNAEKTSGGSDGETDAAFRIRIKAWFETLRRGIVNAIETGALFVPGVVTASLDESLYPPTVYIADSTGSANSALVNAVALEEVNWRSAGIAVNVVGATLTLQAIDVTITFAAGVDTAAVRDLIETAIIAELATLKIGETLYRSSIVTAAKSAAGVIDCVVTNPAGNVTPAANLLIRAGAIGFN